ncbi:RNA-binding protein [Rhodospirillaceae bacterium SYSU D60014]|uniref:RNA-binding protein n=1 Tax=Virgifigura deserti TaxID=2268457 RepID=UPI000E66B952
MQDRRDPAGLPTGPTETKAVSESATESGEPKGPLRRCLVTRTVRPKASLLRFVVGPDGTVVPDIENRLPGRGLWLSPARDIVATAVRKNLFAKAARSSVKVPADLPDRVEQFLTRRCLDLIGLARRAGQAVAGFEKVRGWLSTGRAGLLLAASDGAADGRRKLRNLVPGLPVIDLFSGAELAGALGRETVVHAAVAAGGFADRLAVDAERLAGIRVSELVDETERSWIGENE